MTENFSQNRWNVFENSGRVADYLYYKGVGGRSLPTTRGEAENADNNGRSGDLGKRFEG
ncbi:MAG: hypothetical protein NC120_01225 [Ruminococcus sp.]|nr:hypothetical protein [Ruminococcus sp.]